MLPEFKKEIKKEIDAKLEGMRKERHQRSGTILIQWLTERAALKPVPDLAARIQKFSKDIYAMCEDMRIEYEKGAFVVKVNGSAEQTFKKLKFGTSWFAPNDDLVTQILAGLDEQFGK